MTPTPEIAFLLGMGVFWTALFVLSRVVRLDKHGLEVKPFYFMYKSKALNETLDRWAKKQRKLWLVLSNVSIALGVGLMAFSVYFLLSNLLRFISAFFSVSPISGVAPIVPVIPVLTIRLYWLPYFFLAVAIVILSHELAHGIIARLENIPVLSTGVVAFLLFFGAFVEPNEEKFEKAPLLARLRMLTVGSSINLITALLVALLMTGIFVPSSRGILIQEVIPNSPAAQRELRQWDVIQAINGTQLYTPTDYDEYMSNIKPNTTLVITVLHGNLEKNLTLTTIARPSNRSIGAIGVILGAPYRPNRLGLDQYTSINLYWTLFWIYVLAFSVAIFNMLPAYPFDGERVLYYPLERLVKKRKRELRVALSVFTWGLLLSNIFLSFWRFGFLRL
jgi:membrane-associated protease RseP (regulator of RpoE activity)